MPERLPLSVNFERAAGRGLEGSGDFSLAKMTRLRDRLAEPFGQVSVKLKFGKLEKRKFLNGRIIGQMVAECQRCMTGVDIPVDHHFKLGMVESEAEIDELLPGQEPILVSNEDIYIADIIEDELELLLPMVVLHDESVCQNNYAVPAVDELPAKDEATEVNENSKEIKRPNPFAVLSSLKKS